MPIDSDAIQKKSKATKSLVAPLTDALTSLEGVKNEKDAQKKFQDLIEARETLDDAINELALLCGQPPPAPPTTFADFLSDVGDAAVSTQRKLDEENIRSVQLALAAGQAPSGVFRLPSVKGEVKFGFSKTSGNRLGLVFYSRKTAEETRNEQSMQFEIVSTPPPPELLQIAARRQEFLQSDPRRRDFALRFELVPERRAEILKVFRTPSKIYGKDPNDPDGITNYTEHTSIPEARLSRIIILYYSDTGSYFLLYADEIAPVSDRVGIWQVKLSDKSLHIVWRLNSGGSSTENIDTFRRWILALGKRQEELL